MIGIGLNVVVAIIDFYLEKVKPPSQKITTGAGWLAPRNLGGSDFRRKGNLGLHEAFGFGGGFREELKNLHEALPARLKFFRPLSELGARDSEEVADRVDDQREVTLLEFEIVSSGSVSSAWLCPEVCVHHHLCSCEDDTVVAVALSPFGDFDAFLREAAWEEREVPVEPLHQGLKARIESHECWHRFVRIHGAVHRFENSGDFLDQGLDSLDCLYGGGGRNRCHRLLLCEKNWL